VVQSSIPLTDQERHLLRCGLTEWGGPAHCTDALAQVIGFADAEELLRVGSDLADRIERAESLSDRDWRRALVATEFVFASDVFGSGVDWQTTTGLSDAETIALLRSVQRKLSKFASARDERAPLLTVIPRNAPRPRLVPELSVTDIGLSVAFWRDRLGFRVLYERPEDGFAAMERDGVEIMLDQIDGGAEARRGIWETGPLQRPFGRGINFELVVDDFNQILKTLDSAGVALFFGPEERWYRVGADETGVRQALVQDPDGYLIRLQMELGTRPAKSS
jgi:catechol 2,3-dioxygenase-like lactoylglutathione lyase family enzyme